VSEHQPDSDRLLAVLAQEMIEALGKARQKNQTVSIAALAQSLGDRKVIMELVQKACADVSMVRSDEEEQQKKIKTLQDKYNKISDELRRCEIQTQEIDDSFKQLTVILASLSQDPQIPQLDLELKRLKNKLRTKTKPGELDHSARVLKEFVYRKKDRHDGKDGGASSGGILRSLFKKNEAGKPKEEAAGDPGNEPVVPDPEGLEETIRDILIMLVKDISEFEDSVVQANARHLIKKINDHFSVSEYKPFVEEIHELIFGIKDVVLREKKALYLFTQEVISSLEETEQDLLRNIDSGTERLSVTEHEFAEKVADDMKDIERSLTMKNVTIDDIRGRVFEKIAAIREHFRKKRAEDEALIQQMVREKNGVEKRFQSIHERYRDFSRQRETMMKEMEAFRQASLQDGLTGIFNRRAYDLQLEEALKSLQNGELVAFALIVFDIDNFKEFNNNYGHRAGDLILKHVSKIVQGIIRRHDVLCRYGGDEFTIILPEASLDIAGQIAEKIRSSINEVEFKIYRDRDLTVRVGLSMGVSQAKPDDHPSDVFQRADKALYLAKERGRNQVCLESEI
jgi:diguanylate cyclase